ncbi:unknown [Sinorhizobium phage PBC5]|uniref:hypothetical protein n=1 Tax=Sinorhizobium phage PBC5 TaxID=179237 RepID=UPI000009BAFC|nr:hypothetical protein PBC5_gp47 [Sinorhizobium phage PBC5]AAL49610.1 unknown [Sinorhizobium phage PBC5]
MQTTPDISGAMPLERARQIVTAINHRAFFAMGISDKSASLEGVTLIDMIEAKARVEKENDAPPVDGKKAFTIVPDDRLIAAAYALEHYDGDKSAVAVVPGRDMFGEPCRKALGVVQLAGLRDPEGEE